MSRILYRERPASPLVTWGSRATEARTLAGALLVSSEVGEGRQAPALLFSVPAALTSSRRGLVLWLDLPRSEITIALVSGALLRAGMARTHPRAERLYGRRLRSFWYRRAARRAVCATAFSGTFGVLAREHQGSFEELCAPVEALVPFGSAPGPEMRSPWPFLLGAPARLLDSPAGKLLFLDCEVDGALYWDAVGWLAYVDALVPSSRDISSEVTIVPLPA